VGRQLQLAVDPARFHYFDPETGDKLHTARTSELTVAR
jgi:hypothetical protein